MLHWSASSDGNIKTFAGGDATTLSKYMDVRLGQDEFPQETDGALLQVQSAPNGQVLAESAFLRAFLTNHRNENVATATVSAGTLS